MDPDETKKRQLISKISSERALHKKRKLQQREQAGQPPPSHARPLAALPRPPALPYRAVFWNAPAEPEAIVLEHRNQHGVRVLREVAPENDRSPGPVSSWSHPGLPVEVFSAYRQSKHGQDLREPTPVQSQLWPAMLSGYDVLAVAPTGSGKTLGFCLPIVPHCLDARKTPRLTRGPTALVLAPTRELCAQIARVCKTFKRCFEIRTEAVYGGSSSETEAPDETRLANADVVVATPGRCKDLMRSALTLSSSNVTLLILDEFDRLLEMGFRQDLQDIVSSVRENRQTVLTSATATKEAQEIALASWLSPKKHVVFVIQPPKKSSASAEGGEEENKEEEEASDPALTTIASSRVTQTVHVCAEHKKPRKLIRFIEKTHERETKERPDSRDPHGPMLVFCNQIKTVLFVHEFLVRQNCARTIALHGGMDQTKREKALSDFRAGKYNIMVATDVAARGIHLDALEHVVMYDFPTNLEVYTHRVGRVGRGRKGLTGTSYAFFTRNLRPLAPDLVKLLRRAEQTVDPYLLEMVKEMEGFENPVEQIEPSEEALMDYDEAPPEGEEVFGVVPLQRFVVGANPGKGSKKRGKATN